MPIKIETPPALMGPNETQIANINSYLFRLAEMLNIAFTGLENSVVPVSGPASKADAVSAARSYNELRELIRNTAQTINYEIANLNIQLQQQQISIAEDWGIFQSNIANTIEAVSKIVIANKGYDSEIAALQAQAAGFSEHETSSRQSMRNGFIEYDSNNKPILGIGFGAELESDTVTIDGQDYQQISDKITCAFFTESRLSFRINGREIAHVSNGKLNITDIAVNNAATMGDKWLISSSNGLTIKWIGG